MATKTKARKSTVAATAELQEAIRGLQRFKTKARRSVGLNFACETFKDLREAQASLSKAASILRGLHRREETAAKAKHRSAPRKRTRPLPTHRTMVHGPLSPVSQWYPRKPKKRLRKRVARKPSLKEFFDNINLPH